MYCENCGNKLETIMLGGARKAVPYSLPCQRCEFAREIKSIEVNKETPKEYHDELEFWREVATKSLELAEKLDRENKRLNTENVKLRLNIFENKKK
ncbi:hypothetical protein [Mammaliicoccus lentus]|uniref:hypothetical protein n=1 Tax=Mammaliicoccus lentus TaxID=42858 RepID=UPI0010725856|nr:hypothetical protein [Mammaliicoccus lentus]MBF0793368.1 hypothetical protein [Mammaliicoccus lentus]TFV17869.1 hypothetical protein E4T78_01795 [Mammaliicoccus lentus]